MKCYPTWELFPPPPLKVDDIHKIKKGWWYPYVSKGMGQTIDVLDMRICGENNFKNQNFTSYHFRCFHGICRKVMLLFWMISMLTNPVWNRFQISKTEICMVGDRLDTDILFGQNGGCKTLLVLSGTLSLQWAHWWLFDWFIVLVCVIQALSQCFSPVCVFRSDGFEDFAEPGKRHPAWFLHKPALRSLGCQELKGLVFLLKHRRILKVDTNTFFCAYWWPLDSRPKRLDHGVLKRLQEAVL